MFSTGEAPETLPSDPNQPPSASLTAPMTTAPPVSFDQLLTALEQRISHFRAEAYTGEQAAELVRRFDRLARLATVAGVLAAGRVQETRAWETSGARTAQAWLADATGIDVGEAGRRLKLGARLDAHPAVDRLARSGDVSLRKVELAASTAEAVPDAACDLAAAARDQDLGAFRATCLRRRLDAEPDEVRQARHQRERTCRASIDAEGRFSLVAKGPAAEGAELLGVLRAYADDALRRLVSSGGVREVDDLGGAATWDGLVALFRVGASPISGPDADRSLASADADEDRARRPARLRRSTGSQAKVIFRVDAEAARRGRPEGDEVCEIAGVGPVDIATVDRVIAQGAFVAAVTTRRIDPGDGEAFERVERVHHHGRAPRPPAQPDVDRGEAPADATTMPTDRERTQALVERVTDALDDADDLSRYLHPGRRPTAHQATALDWRDPICSVEGCTMPVGLETDHTEPWTDTHVTTLDDLNRRCRTHHRVKTAEENRARSQARSQARSRASPPPDA